MKTELLAPAKNKEIAFAAIDCGADAVYIGASSFGARINAGNLIEDIEEVVNYAHKFWAKVFVTVNTILKDDELEEAYKLIKSLANIGVDAILIQDMGLLNLIIKRKNSFELPLLHASTQCDNRTADKVLFLKNVGIKRVVLARELSLNQIKEIHKKVPDIELEGFIHGALCVSYSGQCYLSQFIGGRSANRGECAQPCRKKYSVLSDNGKIIAENIYPLCLKDFNASEHIKEMITSGIYSFKIEGRLKDETYVKNIVSYYRKELDKYSQKASSGKSFIKFTPNPEKSFNRGFTDYFLIKRCDCFNFASPKSIGEFIGKIVNTNNNSFTIKTNKNLHAQDGICCISNNNSDGFLINKVIKKSENLIEVFPNKKVKIQKGNNIYRNQDTEFEKELSKPVKRQIGITVNVLQDRICITDENGISIDTEISSKEKANNQEKMNETFINQFSKTGESDFYIESININSDIPFMPIGEINKLRRDAFEKLMQKRLECYKQEIQTELNYTDFYKKECDYKTNINNNEAKEFYTKCGCDIKEMSLEKSLPDRQIELMRTKHCIKYALNMCKSTQNLMLKDEKGQIYPLKFYCKECEMAVLSPDR